MSYAHGNCPNCRPGHAADGRRNKDRLSQARTKPSGQARKHSHADSNSNLGHPYRHVYLKECQPDLDAHRLGHGDNDGYRNEGLAKRCIMAV